MYFVAVFGVIVKRVYLFELIVKSAMRGFFFIGINFLQGRVVVEFRSISVGVMNCVFGNVKMS